MRYRFVVEVDVPSGVTPEEFREYIETEVQANVGRYPPEEPIFHLDRKSVKVFKGRKTTETLTGKHARQYLYDDATGYENTSAADCRAQTVRLYRDTL